MPCPYLTQVSMRAGMRDDETVRDGAPRGFFFFSCGVLRSYCAVGKEGELVLRKRGGGVWAAFPVRFAVFCLLSFTVVTAGTDGMV